MVLELIKCDTTEKRLITGLLVLCVVCVLLYAYFVNQTVANVVERRVIEEDTHKLSSSLGALSQEYIYLESKITRERAQELGFREISAVTYISRDQFTLSQATDL